MLSLISMKFIIFLSRIYGLVHSITTPPPGCIVVSPNRFVASTGTGPIQRAINSLKGQTGPKVIFIRPGKYVENLVITYKDPLTIIGFSQKDTNFAANEVSIIVNTTAGSTNPTALKTGVLIKKNDFVMKNINITSSLAQRGVTLMAEGSQHAYRGCSFSGLQSTLFIKSGAQFFENCNIEGSSDVVLGASRGWFESCTVGIKPSRTQQLIIASNKRMDARDPSAFVFNKCTITSVGGIVGRTIFLEMDNKGPGAIQIGRRFLSSPPPKPVDTSAVFSGVNVTTWFYEIRYTQVPTQTVLTARPPSTPTVTSPSSSTPDQIPVITKETTEFTQDVVIYMPQFVPLQPKVDSMNVQVTTTTTTEEITTVKVDDLPPPPPT